MKSNILGTLIVACATLFTAGFAHADSYTDPTTDVEFIGTVTGSTVTVEIECLSPTLCSGIYIGDVTLKGLTFTGTPTTDSGSASGWVVANGGQNNDAIGSTTPGTHGCNGTQGGMAICWDANLPLSTTLGSGPITLIADLPDGVGSITGLDVQATGYNNTGGTQTGGGKVLAVSNGLTAGVTTVPEPNTLVFLGSGLLALTLLGRRFVSPFNRN